MTIIIHSILNHVNVTIKRLILVTIKVISNLKLEILELLDIRKLETRLYSIQSDFSKLIIEH